MKNQVQYYNVLFPIWFLIFFPQTWLIIIPANFIIDSLVVWISSKIYPIENSKKFYKSTILKVFLFGFLADIIGSSFLLVTAFMDFSFNPMGDSLFFTIPACIISMICIYLFNSHFTFKNLNKQLRHNCSLTLAIATAPYTFLIPSSLIY